MKTFYKFLFLVCLVEFSSTVKGLDEEGAGSAGVAHTSPAEEGSSSPNRSQATPLFETPGQFLSLRQAEVLKREAFEEVVGSEAVAQWDIDWEVFGRIYDSPHSSAKLENISRLAKKMKVLARRNTDLSFDQLHGQVLQIKERVEDIHLERLEGVVKKFLLDKYPGADIDFDIKEGGDQLGTTAFVRRPREGVLKFYVKTHSEGKLADKSSAAKRVNAGELFFYEVLYELGMGCKTYFCARSSEDVYISTLDAATDGSFFLFEKAKEDAQGLGKSLWGEVLGALHTSPQKNNVVAVESALETDPVGQHFVRQASTLDLLSRLGKVHDLLNNPQNFGFFQNSAMPFPYVRIIDFRIPEKRELPLAEGHFRSFLDGNGFFNYSAAHPTIRYALHDRLKHKRVETALWVVREGPLRDMEGAIERAYGSVLGYFHKEASVFREALDSLLSDLEFYRSTLHQNHRELREKLDTWRPEVQEGR